MTPLDYDYLQSYLRETSGLVLAPDKHYLIESRLTPIAKAAGLDGISGLVEALKAGERQRLADAIVEAMTTNESFFFRDRKPFEMFGELMLPALAKNRKNRKLRLWSAAAAHGQEPYSLMMALLEKTPQFDNWEIEMYASDISKAALDKAEAGIYSQFEVQRGMPIQLLIKYFDQQDEMWQVKPEVRSKVKFAVQNLIKDFSQLGVFDVIYCRNVLIYFDAAHRQDVLTRLSACLAPDGYLVLGAAETVIGSDTCLTAVEGHHGLYQLGAGADAAPMQATG